MDEIGVSVYCLVYNHAKYIRECLESIVHQETSFRFNVIVHDDASTDGSGEIIKEFADLYPDIIIPIIQTENQHQKGRGIVKQIEPLVTGKYVAVCEGDDYWCSTAKLQKQFDIMEQNPTCGLCLHRTMEVTEDGKETGREFPCRVFETGFLPGEELIDTIDESRLFHTSAFFMRGCYWHDYIVNPPDYRSGSPVGDVPIMLYFGSKYPVYQINEVLSCYRRGAPSSWSNRIRYQNNWDNLAKHHQGMLTMFLRFDKGNKEFHKVMRQPISKQLYANCALTGKMRLFLKKEYLEYFNTLAVKKRLSVIFGILFPSLLKKMYVSHLVRFINQERAFW